MTPDYILKAVSDPSRPPVDRDRDASRKPVEVLAFAGVKPGMKVAELIPLGGYYTRLLSLVVGPSGRVYGAEVADWDQGEDAAMAAEPGRENVSITLGRIGELSPPERVDIVWATQNYHDLHIAEYGAHPAKFNRLVYEALVPGGTFFLSDHQANPETDDSAIARLHRIEKDQVIREVTAAGFTLIEESSILSETADDHSKSSSDDAVKGRTDQFLLRFTRD